MTTTLPSLRLADSDPAELSVDALVIGVYRQAPEAPAPLLIAPGAESIVAAFDGRLVSTLALLGATGATGEVTKLPTFGAVTAPVLAVVGLGAEPAGALPTPEVLRRAAGAAVRSLAGLNSAALAIATEEDPATDEDHTMTTAALRALAEGGLLGGYRFVGYATGTPPRASVSTLTVHVPDAAAKAARAETKRALTVTRAVATARDWVNTPANDLRPPQFADQVTQAATAAGLAVRVLDEKELRKNGFGGITAVGQGSSAPPRLVRLTYQPPRGASRSIALVGKGVTFDSGGLSIKPAQNMWEMKTDMAGAAAVAAVMLAIAALKPRIAVTGYLPMAENMVSGSAYRPGDVVTMRNGKRVEILNTDAEGRLLLGDAMAWACEDKPDYLVETSTLTGGQIVALGKRVSGVMGTVELCARVREIGQAVGEPAWPMPLPEDVRTGMASEMADICQVNAGMDRAGHMLQGGIFLSEFVTEGTPWAHLDIAGPSYHSGEPTGYWARGATGVPVRTLIALVESLAATRSRGA